MKKVTVLVLICCGLLAACGGDENAKFKQALYSAESGRYNDALQLYSSVIKMSPKNFGAYTNRGMVYETLAMKDYKNRKKHLENAEKDYIKAVQINPHSAQALNNLGAFYLEHGKYYNAIIFLTRAVDKDPHYYTALVNRGIAYYSVGEGINAYNDFYRAVNLDRRGWAGFFNRGVYYYDTGDYLGAALDFTEVIDLRPDFARAFLERGRALKMNDMYADAMDDFKTAVYMEPGNPLAHYYLGEMLFKDHQYIESLNELTKAKELDPGFTPTYELMGDILSIEDPVAAASNYVIARKLDPGNAAKYTEKIRKMTTDAGREEVAAARYF